MGNDGKTSEQRTKWTHVTRTVFFWSRELTEASQWLRTARKNYWMRCKTINEKDFKYEQGIFRSLWIGISNNWTYSLLNENSQPRVQNFCDNSGYVFKTLMSQGIVPLNSEWGYLFENRENAKLLRETFFTGEHLAKFGFHKFLTQSTKRCKNICSSWSWNALVQWLLSWQEVKKAIKQRPTANKLFDKTNVEPKMLKKTRPSFRELMLQLFDNCLEEEIWPWQISKGMFL